MGVVSAGGCSTDSVSAMASLCLWKEDQFFRLLPMPDFFLLEIRLREKMMKEKSDINETAD